jgi:TonB dependent receptor
MVSRFVLVDRDCGPSCGSRNSHPNLLMVTLFRVVGWMLLSCAIALAESSGELRLKIVAANGSGVKGKVLLLNGAKDVRRELESDTDGGLVVKGLPVGAYELEVSAVGFAKHSERIELTSSLPVRREVRLAFATVNSSVEVKGVDDRLIDPASADVSVRLDEETLGSRSRPTPGRGIADAVAAQPGWLMEANGVLHPRGSEYQVQYLVDGVPLTDNRSSAFAGSIGEGEIESVTVRTGSYPAELGRKLGGVIEVQSKRDSRKGLHGEVDTSLGSFESRGAGLEMQYGWKSSTLSWTAEGAETGRYLDPPAIENFSNRGTLGSFAARFDRTFGDRDSLGVVVRQQLLRFLVPNEPVQEQAGQRIARDSLETSLTGSYQHIFSENVLVDFHGMLRDVSAGLRANEASTPIAPFQDRGFREVYQKSAVAVHHRMHDAKAGVEYDALRLHENFRYHITDSSGFDLSTPLSLSFVDRARGAEVGAFVQDEFRFGSWTASAGVRWDHYKLLVSESAISPRLGISKYFAKADLLLHASYDRAFQTPAIENLLVASSPQIAVISNTVVRLPVRPSRGDFYEAGITKALAKRVRIDVTFYRRQVEQFADDDVLLNTGVSFPIAFSRATVYGAEGKLEIPRWNRFSGFISYSYLVGRGELPATGGLLLGDDASQAALKGSFRISQDQRNTVSSRFRFEATRRIWVAAGGAFGSGLPVELDSVEGRDEISAADPEILRHVNILRGRLRADYSVDISGGIVLRRKERQSLRVQVDLENLTNHLNVINFAGLFSGTALGPTRSAHLSLKAEF